MRAHTHTHTHTHMHSQLDNGRCIHTYIIVFLFYPVVGGHRAEGDGVTITFRASLGTVITATTICSYTNNLVLLQCKTCCQ